MKSKQRFWRALLIIVVLTICALLAGCSGDDKIGAPFDDYEYKEKNVVEITALLEEAGFTNIQTEAQDTTSEFNADQVISVKIGSNTQWNEANTWKPDTEVTITYYNYTGIRHIAVTVDITVGGEDGKPVFTVQTNLPDGTVLNAELSYDGSLSAGHADYMETQDIIVQDGVAQTAAYTKDGEPLVGTYRFGILMLPADQAEHVQEITGVAGEALKGDLVEKYGDYQYIVAKTSYESPIQESPAEIEQISEAELDARLQEALSGFGGACEITLEGYLYTVNVWQDNLAQTAALASAGDAEAAAAWDKVAASTAQASDSLQKLLEISGYGDYMIEIHILNDINRDNILLTAMWGMVTYNCAA